MAGLGFIYRHRAGSRPTTTTVPTVTGIRQEGQLLTGHHGTYTGTPISYTYRWLRDGVAIGSATSLTYTPVLADVGCLISFEETPINAAGPALSPAVSLESEVIAASSDPLPATQTISFGKKTLRGFGGHDLAYAGAGTLTIDSDPSGLWTIADNRLVLAGTYAATPPALTGPYTVGVTDGVDSSTVTVNIVDNTYHISPINADVLATDQLAYMITSCTTKNFGDTIISRDGVYNAPNAVRTLTPSSASRPTVRVGGPAVPTEPYYAYAPGHPYYKASTTYDGWITVTSENGRSATITNYKIDTKNLTASGSAEVGGLYMRFYKLTTGLDGQYALDFISTNTSNRRHGWVQIEDNVGTGVRNSITSGSHGYNFFIYDNNFNRNNLSINILSYDSIYEGNVLHDVWVEDIMKHSMYSVNRRSRICWNYCYNKTVNVATNHGDFLQGLYGTTSGGTNYTPFLSAGANIDGFDCYGNIFVRGDPAGVLKDGQGPFTKDVNSGITMNMPRYLGNVLVNQYSRNGIYQVSGIGTIIAHNTLLYDYAGSNPGSSREPGIDIHGSASTGMVIRDNVTSNSVISDDSGGVATLSNNLLGPSDEAAYRELYDDPDLGPSLNQGIAEVVRQLNPKAGSDLLPVGENKIGATGTYLNFTDRTFDFSTTGATLDAFGLPID